LIDSAGTVWLFWNTNRGATSQNIWSKRFRPAAGAWDADQSLVASAADDFQQTVLEDSNTNLWLHYMSPRNAGRPAIFRRRYIRLTDTWDAEAQVVGSPGNDLAPSAVRDSGGTIYLAWQSSRDGDDRIYWNRYNPDGVALGAELRLTAAAVTERAPALFIDRRNTVWAFWRSRVGTNFEIKAARFNSATTSWEVDPAFSSGSFNAFNPSAAEDSQGNIWLFYRSARPGGEVLAYRILSGTLSTNREALVTLTPGSYIFGGSLRSEAGSLLVSWSEQTGTTVQAYYRRFFPVI
ncbi:MAG: hypothetical protein HGA45_44320, partial [Chloroflexales bacterium]|nr:hypothetical protein [Chloroflexales bacterium]